MIDNNHYSELQDKWLTTKDKKYLVDIYYYLLESSNIYIKSYCTKKKIYFSTEYIKDRAMYVAELIVCRYLRPKPFKVVRLTALLWDYVRKVLVESSFDDQMVSFEDFVETSIY